MHPAINAFLRLHASEKIIFGNAAASHAGPGKRPSFETRGGGDLQRNGFDKGLE
jgi:hypothetical protein